MDGEELQLEKQNHHQKQIKTVGGASRKLSECDQRRDLRLVERLLEALEAASKAIDKRAQL